MLKRLKTRMASYLNNNTRNWPGEGGGGGWRVGGMNERLSEKIFNL